MDRCVHRSFPVFRVCDIFAACTGSGIAGTAIMTKVALPSMPKYKHDTSLIHRR